VKRSALAILFLSVAIDPGAYAADHTLITDVTIVSPENLDHQEIGNVLIEDDKIVVVQSGTAIKAPPGTRVVSAHGQPA
jgi:imidazolonepropionase-like amidohydrolase